MKPHLCLIVQDDVPRCWNETSSLEEFRESEKKNKIKIKSTFYTSKTLVLLNNTGA